MIRSDTKLIGKLTMSVYNLSDWNTNEVKTSAGGKIIVKSNTVSIPKGKYLCILYAPLSSSTGQTVSTSLIISGISKAVCSARTNSNSFIMTIGTGIFTINEDISNAKVDFEIAGSGTSICTLASYSTFGALLIKLS